MNQITDQLIYINSLLRSTIQKLESNRVLIHDITIRNKNLLETYRQFAVNHLKVIQKGAGEQQTFNNVVDNIVLPEFKPLEYTVYEFKPLPKRNNRQRDAALKLIDSNIAKLQSMQNKHQLKGDPTFNTVFNRQHTPHHNYSVLLHKQNNACSIVTNPFKIKYRGKHRPSIWSE